jgi:ABC-type phosphate/phosphonate transport system substrate-binding protein
VISTDASDAVKHLREGKADAVTIPTPMLGGFPDLNPVETTEPTPHQGFTASAAVPEEVAKKIRMALLNASKTKEGKKILSAINVIKFVPATAEIYKGYSSLLDAMKKR